MTCEKLQLKEKKKRSDSVLRQNPYVKRKFKNEKWQHKKRHKNVYSYCGPTQKGGME